MIINTYLTMFCFGFSLYILLTFISWWTKNCIPFYVSFKFFVGLEAMSRQEKLSKVTKYVSREFMPLR